MVGSDTPRVPCWCFNLTENAIRYSRPDYGWSAFLSSEEGDRVCLRVKDQPVRGYPSNTAQSIFQPFFRVDKSRSREHGGVGLGLALVWEIAVLHGGTAQVEESSENGTAMLIALPKRGINSGDGVAHPAVDKNLKARYIGFGLWQMQVFQGVRPRILLPTCAESSRVDWTSFWQCPLGTSWQLSMVFCNLRWLLKGSMSRPFAFIQGEPGSR